MKLTENNVKDQKHRELKRSQYLRRFSPAAAEYKTKTLFGKELWSRKKWPLAKSLTHIGGR
jgi:hypothetical protein